jgi:hypothetical protein
MPNIALIPDKKAFRHSNHGKNESTGRYAYAAGWWLSADPALGEYIPSAPVSEEARRRNGNLPGMGGVFNYVNLHAYHYAGNNPVKYTDPDGRETVYFGVTAQAGAGSGVQVGKGFFVSFGKGEFRLGKYKSKSLGAEYGVQAGAGFIFGVDKNNDISGDSLTIGGSGGEGMYFGGDVAIGLETKSGGETGPTGISFSVGLGVGSPGEGHINYTHTETSGIDGAEIARSIKNEMVRRLVGPLPPPEFYP